MVATALQGIDLHFHSKYSDGALAPRDVVALGVAHGARLLALTDHDTLAGLEEAEQTARQLGVYWWHGVEISVSWGKHTLHVVGLGIDRNNEILQQALDQLRSGRWVRAQAMAEGLAQAGIPHTLEGALSYNEGKKDNISRTHFARFLVAEGYVPNMQAVFRRFLTEGKPGFVRTQWADLEDAIGWIRQAGGHAVLAHPGRYDMSRAKLVTLLDEFRRYGGCAIEVMSSSHTRHQIQDLAVLCQQFELMASVGSDFHAPHETWRQVGRPPNLPDYLTPVWSKHPAYKEIKSMLP